MSELAQDCRVVESVGPPSIQRVDIRHVTQIDPITARLDAQTATVHTQQTHLSVSLDLGKIINYLQNLK